MRRVLVDDHDALARLRHDVGLVHLRARGAERPVEQLGRALAHLDAGIGGWRAHVEGRLGRFREAERGARVRGHGKAARIGPGRRAAPIPTAPRRDRRAEGGDGCAAAGGRSALALARERLLQAAHQQAADQRRIAEAHLGLGGVHIDVDFVRGKRDEQRHDRVPVARQIVRIGAAHHADEQPVAHRAAVDEEILAERVGARQRRQRGKAFDHDAVPLVAHLDRVGAEIGP